MSTPGTRKDHDRFCRIEQWTEVRDARGRKVGHHLTYELALDDGRILRTRISRPADSTSYGPSLWRHILTTQLAVTEQEFWECVTHRRPPVRNGAAGGLPERALPAQLVHQLLHTAGVPEGDIARLTLEQALEIMNRHWSGN